MPARSPARRRCLSLVLAVGALPCYALVPSCADPPATSASWTFIDSEGGGVTMRTQDVEIVIESGVHYVHRYATHDSTVQENRRTIDGHDFGLRDGAFFIGPKEYGAVDAGDRVGIGPNGVEVNGEPRGPLPESVEREGESTSDV